MNKKIIYILFAGILVFCGVLSAQENNLRNAKYWEKEKDWASAALYYEDYLDEIKDADADVYWHYAHCLRNLYEYSNAEIYFKKVLQTDSLNYPDAVYYLALVKKNNAKYGEAYNLFSSYLKSGRCSNLLQRAEMEKKACAFSLKTLSNPVNVKIEQLSSDINTSSYSEFNAQQLGDSVLFYSTIRPKTQNSVSSLLSDYYCSELYRANFGVNGFAKIKPLSNNFNNPKYHNANFCFDSDYTRMYFTRSELPDPPDVHSEIWVSDYRGGKWQRPYRLGEPVNLPNSISTNPCVGKVNGREVLYFVSDRPGGYGGKDIWYIVLQEDGGFSEAVNAGSYINTPGNEITPFYDSKKKLLYFSSDWHIGMGGYDIFSAEGGMGTWRHLRNLGYPLNSPANDVYFVKNRIDNDGYFASNRRSPYALKDAFCCNDIYSFEYDKFASAISCDTFFLPETPASKASSLLPLKLYFHNDEPNPRSNLDTSTQDYIMTWKNYVSMQPLYEKEYSLGLSGSEVDSAIAKISAFFTDFVAKGEEDLNFFLDFMKKDMELGNRVILTVDGHASPLFSEEYNRHLSSRRITCLINSIRKYDDGFFIPYISDGKLKIIQNPLGKYYASPFTSDNPHDQRNSIYSRAAALERKIQISKYFSEKSCGSKEFKSPLTLPDSVICIGKEALSSMNIIRVQVQNESDGLLTIQSLNSDNKDVNVYSEAVNLNSGEKTYIVLSFDLQIFEHKKDIFVFMLCVNSENNLSRQKIRIVPVPNKNCKK